MMIFWKLLGIKRLPVFGTKRQRLIELCTIPGISEQQQAELYDLALNIPVDKGEHERALSELFRRLREYEAQS